MKKKGERPNRYQWEAWIMLAILPFIIIVGTIFGALIVYGHFIWK